MEQKARERVVGAAVLMAVAVIFIPMVLSGPAEDGSDDARETAPESPQSESRSTGSGFSSRIVPLGEAADAGRAALEDAPPSDPPTLAPTPEPAPSASVPKPVPDPVVRAPSEPPSRPQETPARSAPKPAAGEGWVVQLGSFSNPRNAHALRDRLKSKGYAAFAVSSGTGKDAVTRVYVGPEADRSKAESHVARLLDETRLKGIVVRQPDR